MIATALGIIVTLYAVGVTFHLVSAVIQTFFGFDGHVPWKNDVRYTDEQARRHWWEFGY